MAAKLFIGRWSRRPAVSVCDEFPKVEIKLPHCCEGLVNSQTSSQARDGHSSSLQVLRDGQQSSGLPYGQQSSGLPDGNMMVARLL